MFGASPGSFKNLDACVKVATGYETEENEKWTVVVKNNKIDNNKVVTYYTPCREKDLDVAIKEGWESIKILDLNIRNKDLRHELLILSKIITDLNVKNVKQK